MSVTGRYRGPRQFVTGNLLGVTAVTGVTAFSKACRTGNFRSEVSGPLEMDIAGNASNDWEISSNGGGNWAVTPGNGTGRVTSARSCVTSAHACNCDDSAPEAA